MYNRIFDFLNKHNILYKYQFGFRKCHSTSLALIDMVDNIYTNIDNKNVIVGIYLDLQKAFDTVDHEILLYKLHMYGIRGTVLHWFRDYLTNRQQFVTIADTQSELCNTVCGVPQGSVLGPLLFLLYVNDIQNCATNISIKLFADDTNVFIPGKSVEQTITTVNDSLSLLNDWFLANKLSLSLDKTSYSTFGKFTCNNSVSKVQLCNTEIKQANCCKYLGLFLDNHLTFKHHIDYVNNKLIKFVSIFYKLRDKLNTQILQMIYFSFVYPHILYGIELYANTSKTALKSLIVLNNKILRVLQQQPYRTHTAELYKRYNTLPIPELHVYQLLLLVHKFIHHRHRLPPAFTDYFLLNSSIHNYSTRIKNDLHLHSLSSTMGKRSIKFKASQLWNQLPSELKQIQSHNTFKRDLKTYLLNNL